MDERRQSMDMPGRRAWLMARMMNRLGVRVADASQPDLNIPLRWACRACMTCKHVDECEAWLSHSNTAIAADAPDFCGNAKIFRRLRATQG